VHRGQGRAAREQVSEENVVLLAEAFGWVGIYCIY
jgi:hypothetical protein